MKNIAIIPNPKKDSNLSVTNRLCATLCKLGFNVYIKEQYSSEILEKINLYSEFPKEAELIIVVGGDGSMLDASVKAIELDIPILGVNLGKVGYLSEVEPDNLEILSRIVSGDYRIEEKMLLSVSANKSGESVVSARLAVNDVIASHDTFLGIADFRLENSVGDCVKYRADGLILSTPAGSTAYSLSAGGPIVSHDIDSIAATPICPHSFFNRSIIFKSNERIKLKNVGVPDLNISIDGRYFLSLSNNDECIIQMADKKLKVLSFSENNLFSTLFKKMRLLENI
jgi:NAD+ kinase